MESRPKASREPIAYVLESLWADLTSKGARDAVLELEAALAVRDYSLALTLAIAIELDRAKRDVALQARPFDQLTVLAAALACVERERSKFLVRHVEDDAAVKVDAKPPPPTPAITPVVIDAAFTEKPKQPTKLPNPPKLR